MAIKELHREYFKGNPGSPASEGGREKGSIVAYSVCFSLVLLFCLGLLQSFVGYSAVH